MNWIRCTAPDGSPVLLNLDACARVHYPVGKDRRAKCSITLDSGAEQAVTMPFEELAALLTRR